LLRIHGVSDLSFQDTAAKSTAGGVKPARDLLGVKIMALLAAVIALACLVMAATNPVEVDVIAHQLSAEGSRLFWIISGVVIATSSALLFMGHLYGLLIWLLVSILALGKLGFDLFNGEEAHTAGWIAAAVILSITVVYGLVRHGRFAEGKGTDQPFSFFPDHLITELMIGTLLLFLLTLLSLVFPSEMGEKANPLQTPEHIKPEWYFFFQFRMLKLLGLNTAIFVTGVMVVLLMFWPWVDSVLERIAPRKDLGVYIGIAAFSSFLVFTVWESLT
jgi:hypothetical protein